MISSLLIILNISLSIYVTKRSFIDLLLKKKRLLFWYVLGSLFTIHLSCFQQKYLNNLFELLNNLKKKNLTDRKRMTISWLSCIKVEFVSDFKGRVMIKGRPMSSFCPLKIDVTFKITIKFVINDY
jgi:hypothetical protein